MSAISAMDFPFLSFDTHPMGCTLTGSASDFFLINSTTSRVWMGGLVLGIQATSVKPPKAAARQPVSIVSLCSYPGSRKCTCISIQPGEMYDPEASCAFSSFPASRSFPISIMLPFLIRISSSVLPSWLRLTGLTFLINKSGV